MPVTFRDDEVQSQASSNLLDISGFQIMKYYFENNGLSEIVIRGDPGLPPPAPFDQLFRNGDGNWPLQAITQLLPQVTAVCLTHVDQDDIAENGQWYMDCIKEWADHFKFAENSHIEFRTKMATEVRTDNTIMALIGEHKKMMRNRGWRLEYKCSDSGHHRIIGRKINFAVSVKEETKPELIWVPPKNEMDDIVEDSGFSKCLELSLDAEPEVLDQLELCDDEKNEFLERAVITSIGQDIFVKFKNSLRIIIDGIKRGSLVIAYRLIADDELIMKEAAAHIDAPKRTVDSVQICSLEIPVNSNMIIDESSISERYLKDEEEQKQKEKEDADLRHKLKKASKSAERMMLELESERRLFEQEREQQRLEFEEKMRSDDAVQALTHRFNDTNIVIDNLHQKLQSSRLEWNHKTQSKFSELKDENQELAERNGRLEMSLNSANSTIVSLQQSVLMLQSQLENTNDTICSLVQSVHDADDAIKKLKQNMDYFQSQERQRTKSKFLEITVKNDQLQSAQKQIQERTESQLSELKLKNNQLRSELNSTVQGLKRRHDDSDRAMSGLTDQMRQCNRTNADLRREVDATKRTVESVDRRSERTQKDLAMSTSRFDEGIKELYQKAQVQEKAVKLGDKWTLGGDGYNAAKAVRIGNIVHLRGLVKMYGSASYIKANMSNAAHATIGKLPLGFRPRTLHYFISTQNNNKACKIKVYCDGTIKLDGEYSDFVSLSSISFVSQK